MWQSRFFLRRRILGEERRHRHRLMLAAGGTTAAGALAVAAEPYNEDGIKQSNNNADHLSSYAKAFGKLVDSSLLPANIAMCGEAATQDLPWQGFLSNAAAAPSKEDSFMPSHDRRLARRRTIEQIRKTAEKDNLESRFKVDWSEPLGVGAFGAVYKGTCRKTGVPVAVKKISKQYTDNASFQREIEALIHIRNQGGHPNICGLQANFEEGSYYYLVMDLVRGGEMFDHLASKGAYSEADASRLMREVSSALAFMHGIDCIHGDLKPENLMLSSVQSTNSVTKVVDFGCAQINPTGDPDFMPVREASANTPAYCPPEVIKRQREANRKGDLDTTPLDQSFDMWALGVILYIMLTGVHPFDLHGRATDEEIEDRILSGKPPPLRRARLTRHLSPSAIDLLERLFEWEPSKRVTALEMLEHPWVRGETARTGKMKYSDERLNSYRKFQSRLASTFFSHLVSFSEENTLDPVTDGEISKGSLIERSFRKLDGDQRGYITAGDLRKLSTKKKKEKKKEQDKDHRVYAFHDDEYQLDVALDGDDIDDGNAPPLSLSGFWDLLADDLKHRYFSKGHVIYRQGDEGHHMYFLNSGTIQVETKEGHVSYRSQGDSFGEGALLNPDHMRSATISCVTPVHAIEISRATFDKYMAQDDSDLKMNLREKDKIRKRQRAKTIVRMNDSTHEKTFRKGEALFKAGQKGDVLYILEEGEIDVMVDNRVVFTVKPGNFTGEHSLLFGRPRNTTAVCVSRGGCKVSVMKADDFNKLMKTHPSVRDSLREICLRREFQKAIVFKTKRAFPKKPEDLKEAFDAADVNNRGHLDLDDIHRMLKLLDPTFTNDDILEILKSLDLDNTGKVSFQEFKHIFRMDDTHNGDERASKR